MRGALALALSAAMTAAQAVDVDRIEILSPLGEPLLAEIPLTGAAPQDLQRLQAQLASSTTFARIGLPRPQGIVADLRFDIVPGERPAIRVTSTQPVQETFFTFLLQLDAPQGRLLREYSIALGASPTLPAQAPPQIQMPVQAEDNAIARALDPADALPAPPEAGAPAGASDAPAIPVAAAAPPPIPLSGDRRPAAAKASPTIATGSSPRGKVKPAPATLTTAPRKTQPTASRLAKAPAHRAKTVPGTIASPRTGDYVVKPGDHLTGIVAALDLAGATEQQAMLALLRTNPQAFARGNINLLQRGAILRMPDGGELTRLDPTIAEAMVRLQIEQWRSGNIPEPAVASAQGPAAPPIPMATSVAPDTAPARLEIAPAAQGGGAGSGAAGTRIPGAGDLAAADALATRYSEMQEMRARIADLEQAQRAQQRLLELKDRQLAAQRPQAAGFWPWLVAALALLVVVATILHRKGSQAPGRVARRLSAVFRARGDESLQQAAR